MPLRNNWGRPRRLRLAAYIDTYRIVYVNRELCRAVAHARTEILAKGTPVETRDVWIAATAVHLGAPLVTHNIKHFRRFSDLEIITLAASSS